MLLAAATDDAAEDGVARVEDQERDLIGSRISIIGLDTIQVSDSRKGQAIWSIRQWTDRADLDGKDLQYRLDHVLVQREEPCRTRHG